MFYEKIPATFIQYAADILGDTGAGLSGRNIVRTTAAYAVEYDVRLPHPIYPFEAFAKCTALFENLMAFSGPQQYRIIKELCDHSSFSPKPNVRRKELKIRLATSYSHLDPKDTPAEVNEILIEETRRWLAAYPDALSLYSQALEKYGHGSFHRKLLDDLRLALEKLLHAIFQNTKSLENQLQSVGQHIKDQGGSPELANMFAKLLEYYTKYNNKRVKHDDAVIDEEIEFVIEITSSFMKHLIRLSSDG